MMHYVVERVFGENAYPVARFADFMDAKDAFWNEICWGQDYDPEVGTMGTTFCVRLKRVLEDELGFVVGTEELMESQDFTI